MGAAVEQVLYAAHQKVYPREIQGRFTRLRVAAVIALLGVFYGLPWIGWRGHQAVLFDLPARKFYIFGLTFFPQDFFFLTWLMVIAALSLFFFTALAGRLWCGYACPQTVWTEVFVWMERLTEGGAMQRAKRDKAPMSGAKFARKSAKQILWIGFSVFTGYTFVGYFTPILTLSREIANASLGGWESFWILFYGFATYGNAGYMREQVCKYMCPYARFQSAMFDKDTLVISYDAARGEPRGGRARGDDAKRRGLGDCIDCTLCVQACPTGIDIRQGLQLECIACAACIDACDSVMDKVGYARGLVRYSTQAAMEGRTARVLRPRTLVYASLLGLLIGGFAIAVSLRPLVNLDVLRDRNSLYRELADGRIENVYTVRIVNKDTRAHRFALSISDLPGATLDADRPDFAVESGSVLSVAVRVQEPEHTPAGSHRFILSAQALDAPNVRARSQARFIAPANP